MCAFVVLGWAFYTISCPSIHILKDTVEIFIADSLILGIIYPKLGYVPPLMCAHIPNVSYDFLAKELSFNQLSMLVTSW